MSIIFPGTKIFKINEFITLRFNGHKTEIYVNNERFIQCKYLLLTIPTKKIREFDEIDSIDDAKERLNAMLELKEESNIKIPPDVEFWAHCSNLQVWVEKDYDTRLLHSNLSFPLLKKLADIGDPKAKIRLPEEIIKRFESKRENVVRFLLIRKYLNYFTQEQKDTLLLRFFEGDDVEMIALLLRDCALDLLSTKYHNSIILHFFDLKPLLRHKHLLSSRYHLMKLFDRLSEAEKIEALSKLIDKGSLDLSNLSLNEIPKEILQFQIKTLNISKNTIEIIPNWFGECTSLQTLNFSNQRLKRTFETRNLMLPESIGNLTNLKYLDLTLCKITHVSDTIGNLNALEILKLSDNKLIEIPQSINNLSNLKELHLDRNKLDSIPDLSNLTSLKKLDLTHNNLSEFPQFILKLTNLEQLFLGFNKIDRIPLNISNLNNLKQLILQDNKLINKIPNSIGKLKNLEFLVLEGNKILNLPEEIGELKNLKTLYLNENCLKNLPDSIGNLINLNELYLEKNQLEKLPCSIEKLLKLKKFDIRWNNIKDIPKSLKSLPHF